MVDPMGSEWFSPGVLKPPLAMQYPEYMAWRQHQLDAGAVELTAEEWAEMHCD